MPIRLLSASYPIPIRFLTDSYQIPIRSPSDPHQIPISYQLPFRFLNSIRCQSDAHQIPIRLPSASLQTPQCNFGAKTDTFIAGVLWPTGNVTSLPIRLLSDSHQIPSDFNEAPIQIPKFNDRCLSDSHQIPIRLPSSSFQIPQRNLIQFGANQLPISLLSDSHQKIFRFINAISVLNQHTSRAAQPILIFVLKQPLLLQGGYGALEMSHSFLSDSYQIPIRSHQIQ